MTRWRIGWLVFAMVGLVAPVESAPAEAGTGIVKGVVTIAGKPTADVVVSVEGVARDPKTALPGKGARAVMDQRNMKFVPHVLPILVGTTVDFPNNDNTWHNVYSKGGAKEFDVGLYPPGKSRSVTFDKPGVARILCNAHPAMEAFIVVKEHPFFSAADSRGNYSIGSVPPGKYRVRVWHPQAGTREAEIQLVREGEVLEVNFDFKRK